MLSLTWPAALAWRLHRQHLDPVDDASTVQITHDLVAVAAQLDPAHAELGIRARRRTSDPGDVARALAAGELVTTFAFRGAVHLMTPEQAAVHLPLRASSRMWERRSWQDFYGLAPQDWPDLRAVVREALTGGPLTRDELAATVAGHPRFAHLAPALAHPSATILKPFAWHGDLSIGPSRDGRLTLQALDGTPHWRGTLDLDEAGPRAVEAYLRAYGPASPEHLGYWLGEGLGVRRTLIGEWLQRMGGTTAPVEVEGEPRLALRDDLDDLAGARPTSAVRLLPRYDQWVLGPGTADSHVVPADLRTEVSRGAGLVVVGGMVAGTWAANGEVLTTRWSSSASALPDDLLDAEVARLAGLLGRQLNHVR